MSPQAGAGSFLPEPGQCSCKQISLETAQSHLDCAALKDLDGKRIMVGCIDLSDPQVESAETVAQGRTAATLRTSAASRP